MKTRLIPLVAATLVLAVSSCAADPGKAPEIKQVKKAQLDDFLATLKGKVVIVDFWATWCPPCRQEIPGFVALQKQYADKGLAIVGLSLDDSVEPVKEFYQANGMNYTVFVVGQDVTDAWGGIDSIPSTFILDKAGKKIGAPRVGFEPKAEFEKAILPLLK